MADYAENKPDAESPPDLKRALRCRRYPGVLPFDGSLASQPAGLLDRMEYLLWVFDTVRSHKASKSWKTWQENNPHGMKLIGWLTKYRKRVETRDAASE